MSSSTPVSYSHSLFKEEEVKKNYGSLKEAFPFLLLFLFSIFFCGGAFSS